MEYSIDDMRNELQAIRQRVHKGELYDSLGSEIGRLLDTVEYDTPTPVVQLDKDDALDLFSSVAAAQQRLLDDEPYIIYDKELLHILSGLKQVDPKIRDKGIFYFLTDGLQKQIFTDQQIILMTRYLLQDSVLFSHITEKENDGIFLRSFAILLLSLLVGTNRRGNLDLFDQNMHETIFEQLMIYIALEQDGRGFVGEKGWAHAFLHIGNLADEISANPSMSRADKLILMTLIVEKLKRVETPLIMGENRRLVTYFLRMVNTHQIYEDYFLKQLKQWRQEMTRRLQPETESEWNRFYNQVRFQQSILVRDNVPASIYGYLNDARNFLA